MEPYSREAISDLEYAAKSKKNAIGTDNGRMPPWRYRESFRRDCEDICVYWIRRAMHLESVNESLVKACRQAHTLVDDEDNNPKICEMAGSFGLLANLNEALRLAEQ